MRPIRSTAPGMVPGAALVLALAATVVLVAAAGAQELPGSANVRRGDVAVEVAYGGISGVSASIFSSPAVSWLVGVDRVATSVVVDNQTVRDVSAAFRIGARRWVPVRGPLDLFIGLGASTGSPSPGETLESSRGYAYSELGVAPFLGPHVSLIAAGEMSVAYARDQGSGGGRTSDGDPSGPRAFVGTRARLGVALYLF